MLVEFHLTATGRHLPYGITQCYLPPDTSERAPPSPRGREGRKGKERGTGREGARARTAGWGRVYCGGELKILATALKTPITTATKLASRKLQAEVTTCNCNFTTAIKLTVCKEMGGDT